MTVASLTIGFTGGLTLTRRLPAEEVEGLRAALADDASPWHELRTDRGVVVVSLPRLAYYELDDSGGRLGFD